MRKLVIRILNDLRDPLTGRIGVVLNPKDGYTTRENIVLLSGALSLVYVYVLFDSWLAGILVGFFAMRVVNWSTKYYWGDE